MYENSTVPLRTPQSLERCSHEALKAYDFVYDVFGAVAPG
jgi:hypothetical protein